MICICRRCQKATELSPKELKQHGYRCVPCRKEYWRQAVQRRKAKGLPTGGGVWDPAKKREYARKYNQRPAVQARHRELWHQYAAKPGSKEKIRARQALNYAIETGQIKRAPCVTCGAAKAQGHHDDYSKPLVVVWLCKNHHRQLHAQAEEGL